MISVLRRGWSLVQGFQQRWVLGARRPPHLHHVVCLASPGFPIRTVLRSSFRLSCSLRRKFSVGFPASQPGLSPSLSALSLTWCWEALENWERRFSEFNRFWSFRSRGVERIWKIESANFGIQQVLERPRLIFVCEGANRDWSGEIWARIVTYIYHFQGPNFGAVLASTLLNKHCWRVCQIAGALRGGKHVFVVC
jgi:hypothetical protein